MTFRTLVNPNPNQAEGPRMNLPRRAKRQKMKLWNSWLLKKNFLKWLKLSMIPGRLQTCSNLYKLVQTCLKFTRYVASMKLPQVAGDDSRYVSCKQDFQFYAHCLVKFRQVLDKLWTIWTNAFRYFWLKCTK